MFWPSPFPRGRGCRITTISRNRTMKRNENPIRLLVVAPDNDLLRAIRVADRNRRFEPVRFRSFETVLEKADCTGFPIVQWSVDEITERLTLPLRLSRNVPFMVYCPELPRRTVTEGESVRFALLQYGASAVFSQLRKLPKFLDLVCRYAQRFPPPEKHWSEAVNDSLPWKTV